MKRKEHIELVFWYSLLLILTTVMAVCAYQIYMDDSKQLVYTNESSDMLIILYSALIGIAYSVVEILFHCTLLFITRDKNRIK